MVTLSKPPAGDTDWTTEINDNWTTIEDNLAAKVRKTADQARTSTTLVDATDLSFAVSANTTYRFKFVLVFQSTATTNGLKVGLTFPAVTVFAATAEIANSAAGTGGVFQGYITASGGSVTAAATPAANTNYLAVVEGIIRPSSSGTLQLQFACEVGTQTITLKANSVGLLEVYA